MLGGGWGWAWGCYAHSTPESLNLFLVVAIRYMSIEVEELLELLLMDAA